MVGRITSAIILALGVVAAASPVWGAVGEPRDEGSAEGRSPSRKARLGLFGGGVGYTAADLTTFVAQSEGERFTADLVPTQLQGPSARLGLGARLSAVSLGVVGSIAAFS